MIQPTGNDVDKSKRKAFFKEKKIGNYLAANLRDLISGRPDMSFVEKK